MGAGFRGKATVSTNVRVRTADTLLLSAPATLVSVPLRPIMTWSKPKRKCPSRLVDTAVFSQCFHSSFAHNSSPKVITNSRSILHEALGFTPASPCYERSGCRDGAESSLAPAPFNDCIAQAGSKLTRGTSDPQRGTIIQHRTRKAPWSSSLSPILG